MVPHGKIRHIKSLLSPLSLLFHAASLYQCPPIRYVPREGTETQSRSANAWRGCGCARREPRCCWGSVPGARFHVPTSATARRASGVAGDRGAQLASLLWDADRRLDLSGPSHLAGATRSGMRAVPAPARQRAAGRAGAVPPGAGLATSGSVSSPGNGRIACVLPASETSLGRPQLARSLLETP